MLPDDTLVDIFDFYRLDVMDPKDQSWPWHTLVHVCRRWRAIIFASPCLLDLRLLCQHGTPVRDGLGYWPPLPITVNYTDDEPPTPQDEDNIVAALEQPDRVCRVELVAGASLFKKLSALIHRPFPKLTHLRLWYTDVRITVLTLTGEFLGGSASHLQSLTLCGIPFPAFPSVILSATNLVSLRLIEIPAIDGYILPEVMVTCLSVLTKLEQFSINFYFLNFARKTPLPLARVILPSLTEFDFLGSSAYLDGLVAQIDTPLLNNLHATVFNQRSIEIPHLSQFILRTGGHPLPNKATMHAYGCTVSITLYQSAAAGGDAHQRQFQLSVSCEPVRWEVFCLAQLSSVFLFPLIAGIEELYIGPYLAWISWEDDDGDLLDWLNILRPFTSVESLYVSEMVGRQFSLILEEVAKHMAVGGLVEEVLPALRVIQFESSHMEAPIEEFVAIRQRSGNPITVHHRASLRVP